MSCLLNYNTIELDAILVEICPKWNGPEDPEKLIKMQANHLKNHIGKKPKNCLLLKQKFREIAHLRSNIFCNNKNFVKLEFKNTKQLVLDRVLPRF